MCGTSLTSPWSISKRWPSLTPSMFRTSGMNSSPCGSWYKSACTSRRRPRCAVLISGVRSCALAVSAAPISSVTAVPYHVLALAAACDGAATLVPWSAHVAPLLLPGNPAVPGGLPRGVSGTLDLLRGVRKSTRQAGGVSTRRSRRWNEPAAATLLRPGSLPHRALRPTRLRQEQAARLIGRQHHLALGFGYRSSARASRRRQLVGVRRLVGEFARAGVCRDAPFARHRAGAARHLPVAALGAGVVLPTRHELALS